MWIWKAKHSTAERCPFSSALRCSMYDGDRTCHMSGSSLFHCPVDNETFPDLFFISTVLYKHRMLWQLWCNRTSSWGQKDVFSRPSSFYCLQFCVCKRSHRLSGSSFWWFHTSFERRSLTPESAWNQYSTFKKVDVFQVNCTLVFMLGEAIGWRRVPSTRVRTALGPKETAEIEIPNSSLSQWTINGFLRLTLYLSKK